MPWPSCDGDRDLDPTAFSPSTASTTTVIFTIVGHYVNNPAEQAMKRFCAEALLGAVRHLSRVRVSGQLRASGPCRRYTFRPGQLSRLFTTKRIRNGFQPWQGHFGGACRANPVQPFFN